MSGIRDQDFRIIKAHGERINHSIGHTTNQESDQKPMMQ